MLTGLSHAASAARIPAAAPASLPRSADTAATRRQRHAAAGSLVQSRAVLVDQDNAHTLIGEGAGGRGSDPAGPPVMMAVWADSPGPSGPHTQCDQPQRLAAAGVLDRNGGHGANGQPWQRRPALDLLTPDSDLPFAGHRKQELSGAGRSPMRADDS